MADPVDPSNFLGPVFETTAPRADMTFLELWTHEST